MRVGNICDIPQTIVSVLVPDARSGGFDPRRAQSYSTWSNRIRVNIYRILCSNAAGYLADQLHAAFLCPQNVGTVGATFESPGGLSVHTKLPCGASN